MEDRALTKLFCVLSAVVIAIATAWVFSSYQLARKGAEAVVAERGLLLQRSYHSDISKYGGFMLETAEYIANDLTVSELMAEGAAAQAAHNQAGLKAARNQLLQHVTGSWDGFTQANSDRIMHFQFSPAVSFLRMHRPDRFGDDLYDIRPGVVRVNATKKPISGYESGRYFRGIRGITPIFATTAKEEGVHVGALEVGIALTTILNNLALESGIHFAVLFEHSHLQETLSDEQTQAYFNQHVGIDKYVLDWRSDPISDETLIRKSLEPDSFVTQTELVESDGRTWGVTQFPLIESATGVNSGVPVGVVMAWFDAEDVIEQVREQLMFSAVVALFIVIIIEGFLFLGLKRESELRKERFMSLTDALSGISNRRHFDETLEQEVRRATRSGSDLSIILGDIDFFKKFNDHYGHQEGDECIQRIAQALQSGLRRAGDFLARYGGEEFVIVLPDTPLSEAEIVAERLRKSVLGAQITHATHPDSDIVTMSFGVASGKVSNATAGKLMVATADRALYEAKASGRDCYKSEVFTGNVAPGDEHLTMTYR